MERSEHHTLNTKGADYTQNAADNRIKNFEDIADDIGLDPLTVWWVYFKKHIDAIKTFVKDRKVKSEPISERFLDARNYLALGRQIIEVYHPDAVDNPPYPTPEDTDLPDPETWEDACDNYAKQKEER